jgi:hypothetical protein
MNTASKLVLLHLYIGLMAWFCLAGIFGRMAERDYNMRKDRWLFFRKLERHDDRAKSIAQQKARAWIGLVITVASYVLGMIDVLSR